MLELTTLMIFTWLTLRVRYVSMTTICREKIQRLSFFFSSTRISEILFCSILILTTMLLFAGYIHLS